MPDKKGAASEPLQSSDMLQKFSLVFKAENFKFFPGDDKEAPTAAGDDSSDHFALLDYAEEVIIGQRVVVNKPDHCRAAPVAAQSWLPEPNLSSAETLGRELQRACGLSPNSPVAAHWWLALPCHSGAGPFGNRQVTPRRVFGNGRPFDVTMPGHAIAAFLARVVLSMIAYEHLHRKEASKCEVFLSFSGEDALKDFADGLSKRMVDAGICVFGNGYWLRQDEKIRFQAIKSSKILIPILSPKYASSKRCLDELVQIMKCKNDSSGHVVLPIFYRRKPARFRCKMDVCGPKAVEEWERALTKVSSLKHWEWDKAANGDGGKLVKLVVRKVLIELKEVAMVITENSVGIKGPLKSIMQFLDNRRASTLYVGIHGEAGVGKTTLAKVIYNKLSDRFDNFSFTVPVNELCESNGMKYLQTQLIRDILKKENVHVEEIGTNILSRFKDKKVVVLLDDVTAIHELEALVGDRNLFASGSRIIITTKNKSVLNWAQVDHVYEHKEMDENEAKILFARHAFRRDSPPNEFLSISNHVVSIIRRFPLILEVMGSYLCGKRRSSWLDIIKDLQNLEQMEVRQILSVIYKALDYEQRKIFLDIACFLVGSDVRIASFMWGASDYHLVLGQLIFMSFVKIGDNHELRMHNELRDLGRSIVREGYGNKLLEGSRLWEYEEVSEVLEENTGTENIEALFLGKNNLNPGQNYTYEQIENLVGLRFLHVSDASFQGDLRKRFSKLRWFRWERCPDILKAWNFGVEKLAVLDLSGSMISENWDGWNSFMGAKKLKVLNLTDCHPLKNTLFLSVFVNLEILILRNCNELEEIHPSIEHLKSLVSLDLSGCSSLRKLPTELEKLEELKELLLDRTNIQEIPSSIGSLEKLEMLSAKGCEFLARTADLIPCSPRPYSIGSLGKLRSLSLQSCCNLRQVPDSIGKLESLAELVLTKTKITELPESIGNLQNLEILNISSTDIEKLPNAVGRLKKLWKLDASKCVNLSEVISSIHDLSSLQHLNLIGCLKLQSLPKLPPALTVVGVTCKSVELPSFSHLVDLKQLRLHDCIFLKCIPELPSTLLELEVSGCEKLQFLTPLESLERLDIIRCKSVKKLDLSKVNHLRVFYAQNCRYIQEIIGLQGLNDLKSLTIQGHPPIELDEPFLPVRNGHIT